MRATARDTARETERPPTRTTATAPPATAPSATAPRRAAARARTPLALAALALLTVVALAPLAGCGGAEADLRLAGEGPEALAALAITATAPAEGDTATVRRAAFLTDRAGAFFYDALAAPQDDPAMGFSVGDFRLLDGWRWHLAADSADLGPADRVRGAARPDFAVRAYAARDSAGFVARLIDRVRGVERPRLTERLTMLDGTGALLVEVPDSLGAVDFRPVVGDLAGASAYQVEARGGTLLIARGNYTARREGSTRPVWLAVRALEGEATAGAGEVEPEAGRRRAFTLGGVRFPTPGALVVASGDTPEAADSAAAAALARATAVRERRSARMADLLARAPFETEDEQVNDALGWALLTLDALQLPDSTTTTLLSGLPSAPAPAGRSTLYALDAFLLTGQFETARALVTGFGSRQRFDRRIDRFGRAPDEVGVDGQGRYTTAAGTALFLKAVGDYVRATGDTRLINPRYWTNTVYGMRGIADEQFGPLGFLRAQPGETWMQARRGGDALLTPREGLPVEAQGLLYRALRSMADFATIMGVARRESAAWYADSADALARKFEAQFVRDGAVADRFLPAGAPEMTARPNALLALWQLDLPPATTARLTRGLAERLAFPYGVATRPQADSAFHPYLAAPGFYAPEEALYDGAVWTWLSGPLISLMARTGGADAAYPLFEQAVLLSLDRGVAGAIPELLDGHPRADADDPAAAPRAGGSPVQPWSVAELLRTAYQDFAGIRYAGPADVVLEPHLPDAWGEVTTRVRIDSGYVALTLRQGDALTVTLAPEGRLPENARLRVRAFGLEKAVALTRSQGDTLTVAAEPVTLRITPDGVTVDGDEAAPDARYEAPDPAWWDGFAFATPEIPETYPVLAAAAEERELADSDLLRENMTAVPILTQTDPDGDDWGATSSFTYPPGFPDGVLDATYLELTEDDSTTYFHIEFALAPVADSLGFPPAMLAIGLNTEQGGTRTIERGAAFEYPRGDGYNYVIFVGDGLRLEDAEGRLLAELPPGRGSLVRPESGSVGFALPRAILPQLPRGTQVTLLVGARTDGSGLGEFRPVAFRASGDLGGGKVDPTVPNVYDFVSGRTSR